MYEADEIDLHKNGLELQFRFNDLLNMMTSWKETVFDHPYL